MKTTTPTPTPIFLFYYAIASKVDSVYVSITKYDFNMYSWTQDFF